MNVPDGKEAVWFRPDLQQAFARLSAAERALLRVLYGLSAAGETVVSLPLSRLETLPELEGVMSGGGDVWQSVLGRLVGTCIRLPARPERPAECGPVFLSWLPAAQLYTDTVGRHRLAAWLCPPLVPFLQEGERHTDKLVGSGVEGLRSAYAVRLLEWLLAAWEGEGIPADGQLSMQVEVGILKAGLGLSETYRDFRNFRRKVLDPACLEIKERTRFHLDIGFRRDGRQVVGVELYLRRKAEPVPAGKGGAANGPRPAATAAWNEHIDRLSDAGVDALHLLLSRGVPVSVAFRTVFPYAGGSEVIGYEDVFVQQLLLLFDQQQPFREGHATEPERLVRWLLTLPAGQPAVMARLTERLVAHKKKHFSRNP
ncbi:MAG: hypothetical protein RLY31_1707 [Bacteroidota bacterium]|jgi:hypothetical protein